MFRQRKPHYWTSFRIIVTCAVGGAVAMCTGDRSEVSGVADVSSTAPVVLVGAGDIADCSDPSDEATAALLDNIQGTVFTAGDNAYPDGTTVDFTQCYDPSWGRHKARTRPSPGNHDYHVSGASDYFAYFGASAGPAGQGYYSYDIGDWHVVSLNSNVDRTTNSPQVTWLRDDLAASTKQCTIAYWHHARFSSGTQHGSNTSMQPIWQALYEAGADIVVSGHEHNYERFAPQDPSGVADAATGIREFVVGTGGASHYNTFVPIANSEVRNGTTWGVLKLTLDAGTYSWQFIPIAGQTFTDAGSGTCHGPPGGGGVSPSQSTVTASPATIVAGGAPSTITVTARDALGNPISGATVVLSATGSGNTLTQPAATTNASGVATGSLASTVVETKTVSATTDGTAITQTATVTVTPPGSGQTISHLLLTAGNNAVNQKVYVTASIAPAPNALVTVAVLNHRSSAAITPTLSGGGMSSWTQVVSVDFDPISSPRRRLTIFRALSPSPGSGPITITFTNNVSNAQWIVSQWTGVETSGVNGSGAIVQSGSSRSDGSTGLAVALNAFARANNVAYGVVGVSGSGPAVTPGNGFAEIAEQPSGESSALETEWTTSDNTIDAGWTSALKAALLGIEIQAAAGGGPAVSASLSAVTAVSPITAGGSSTITVTARDGSGNPVSGVAVTLSATGNNTVTQPASQTGANGVATGSLSATVAGSNTVTAVAGGVTLNQHPVVTVNPGAASALAFTTQPSNTAANAPITPAVVVEIRDQFGNRVNSSANVVMAIGTNPASGTLSGTLTQAAAGGIATFSNLAINNAGSGYTLVASSAGVSNATSSAFTVTTTAPSASLSTVGANPTSFTAGGSSTITVTVKDGQGNAMSGVTVTLSSTVGGDVITQPASATNGSGVTTGTVGATSAGSRTLTAIAGGITLNQKPVVTVNAGPPNASQSTVTAAPGTIVAGSGTSTITVTVKDGFGNPVSGSTVTLSASGTGNTLTQPAGPTNASGVATGSLSSTNPQTVTISATAGGVAITQTASVTVTNQPPAGISHTLLTSGHDVINQRVYTTASIAPAPNALVTVAVMTHQSSAAAPNPTLSGGGMASWDVVATVTFDGATPLKRVTIFRAMSAAPGTGPITITSSVTVSNCQWIVSQWTGVETAGTNGSGAVVQSGTASGSGVNQLTVTLAPFASTANVAYGVFGVNSNVVPTVIPGTGFTTIDEQPSGEGTLADLFAEWAVNRTAVTATWSNKNGGAVGIEVKVKP
jgi:protocatechuate 3,4-dioxygenase beta subunit